MLGRGSSRADTQTTPLGTVGDTREEGAAESRFLFLLVSSQPRWRSLGKATVSGHWFSCHLDITGVISGSGQAGGHFVMDGDNGGQGCGQDGPPGFNLGSVSSQSHGLTLATGVLIDRVD